jgi:hypothetical protein
MINIEVKGFQAIEHIELCIDRFTAIVGGSNIGKSSVVRALKCALTNSVGTSFVRHGVHCTRLLRGAKTCKCQASVHIVMDGFDLLWEKGDAVNRYAFNGETYDKPGTGIPEFLAKTGFSLVKIGDTSGSIQIADQFFPIFMLNQSGPAIAEAISDVSRLDRINRASKSAEKDRKDAIASRKLREEDAARIRDRLQKYEGLDVATEKVAAVEEQNYLVGKTEGSVEKLNGFITQTGSVVSKIRVLNTVSSVAVPEISSVEQPYNKVKTLTSLSDELDHRESDCRSLKWVVEFSDKVPEIEPVRERLGKVQVLDSLIIKARALKEKFKLLQEASKACLPEIDQIASLHAGVVARTGFIYRLTSVSNLITSLTAEINTYSEQETTLEREVAELGICPTCVQPLSLGHKHTERKYA